MEMNRKKKRLIILSVLAVLVLTAGILGGRELWLYEHPEIQITFSHDRSEDLYRSYPICSIRSRSRIGQGYAPRYDEELRQYWEATNEVFMWIYEQYQTPLHITSDVSIGDGKTVISFRGTGTSMTTGEAEEIHRDCVLDFELDAEVLRSEEEEPELTVSVWDSEEEGQQAQAETIYDPEAGVTVTLQDISNIGASIVVRREDEDAGAKVTCGDAYILQRRVDGEWQDAETVIEDYGFAAIGYTVACGQEISNYYKWDWLYGVLEPGEYRMVYDVFRKTEGAGSSQTYREYIRFRL